MAQQEKPETNTTLPPSAQAFIDAVITKMRYRKKVRNEVREELTSHFLDELQACSDPEQRDKQVRQLLTDFGDVKMLGILLRRAKRRCRPMWRTVVARTLQTVGTAILLFVLYAVWFSMGEATVRTDYLALLNEKAKPDIPDADNAWAYYERAVELYKEPPEVAGALVGKLARGDKEAPLAFERYTAQEQETLKKYVAENKALADALDAELKAVAEEAFRQGLVPNLLGSGSGYLVWNRFDDAMQGLCYRIQNPDMPLNPYIPPETWGMPGIDSFLLESKEEYAQKLEKWVKDHESSEERSKTQKALNVAALTYWIEHPDGMTDPLLSDFYRYEVKAIEQWIADNTEAWSDFIKGGQQKYCYRRYSFAGESGREWLLDISIGPLQTIKQLTRQGAWRSQLALRDGDVGQAMDICVQLARIGKHWQRRGTLIEQLVGTSISGLAHRQLLDVLDTADQADIAAADMDRVIQSMRQVYEDGYPLVDLEFEELTVLDTIQHVFTEGGPGGGHLIGPEVMSLGGPPSEDMMGRVFAKAGGTAVGIVHARRDATESIVKRTFESYRKTVKMTPYERKMAGVGSMSDTVDSLNQIRYALVHIMLPALDRASSLTFRGKTLHEATLTILALERWHLEKGRYPETLSVLVDERLLGSVPMDPYSDKPLVYRTSETGYILYDVGTDMKDNGGAVFYRSGRPNVNAEEEGADRVYWPIPKPIPVEAGAGAKPLKDKEIRLMAF